MRPRLGMRNRCLVVAGCECMSVIKTCRLAARESCTAAQHDIVTCGELQVTGNLIEWQRWKIRMSFNYREGVVLHDVG